MTKNEANVILSAILSTCAAVPGGAPAGHLYAALCGRISLEEFYGLVAIAVDVGLVARAANHVLTITPKGKEIADKIDAASKAVG